MARKSRKNLNNQQKNETLLSEEKHTLATAAYARLSSKNEEHKSEDSVKTQVMLIHDYIKNNPDLELEDTYVDYGYTGANFDRPEFERMMKDVCSGRIQCIVVKDLSRFGRDYIETGHYLETIFPRLNVRFIAVTDDFDSSIPGDVESLAVPLKNMVNSLYVKDISHKVKSAFKTRWQQDRVDKLFSRPPYGYVMNEDKTALIPEKGPADTVRVIFHWYLSGVSPSDIAKRLNFIGILSPSEWSEKQGRWKARSVADWTAQTVSNLISCPSYAGDMVYHRTERFVEIDSTPRKVNKEDWITRKDYNEPVVLREDLEAAQELREERKVAREKSGKKTPEPPHNSFRGLLYCGCCRKQMSLNHKQRNLKVYNVYICKQNSCQIRYHSIESSQLEASVMEQIQSFIETSCVQREEIKGMMTSAGDNCIFAELGKTANSLQKQIEEAERREESLYRDLTEGMLDKKEYQYMKNHYAAEKQVLTEKLTDTKKKYHGLERKANAFIRQADQLEQYKGCREFNEELVRKLIDQIFINEDNSLEICFKCGDMYQDLLKSMEGAANE